MEQARLRRRAYHRLLMAETPPTPLAAALDSVGDRWTLLLVEALLDGPRRFGDLQEALGGIAPNVLTQRLRRLEGEGAGAGAALLGATAALRLRAHRLGPRAGRGAAAAGRLGRAPSRGGRAAAPRGLRHARRGRAGGARPANGRSATTKRRTCTTPDRGDAARSVAGGSRIPCNCYVEPFWTTSPHAVSTPEDSRRTGPRRDPQAGPKAPVATRTPSIGAAAWWPRERPLSCCCS